MNQRSDDDAPALIDVLDRLGAEAGSGKVRLGDLFDAFGTRAFGPLLLIPAFIAIAPTGAIPGMSVVTGSLIILIAVQMLLPMSHPWLPERLMNMEFSPDLLDKSVRKVRPYVAKISKVLKPRWRPLARPPWTHAVALVCIAMGIFMFPLALLPFAVLAPGTAIGLLAIGITTRDGLVVAVGLTGAAAAAFLAFSAVV